MIPCRAIPSSRTRARRGCGFSLVEVIAVTVIVAILGAVAVASTRNTYQSRQRAAARQIAAELQFLRDRAMSTGRNHWALFTMAGDRIDYYQTATGAASTSAAATVLSDPVTGNTMVTQLDTTTGASSTWGVELGTAGGSGTTSWIGFDWRGRPTDQNNAVRTTSFDITVLAVKGSATYSTITISVAAGTGLVTVSY